MVHHMSVEVVETSIFAVVGEEISVGRKYPRLNRCLILFPCANASPMSRDGA